MTRPPLRWIRQARLLDGRVVDIEIDDGSYVGIRPAGSAAASTTSQSDGRTEMMADGRLVTESFVNAHLHLDKVFTLSRLDEGALTSYTGEQMAGAATAIDLASAVKAGYERSWIEPNVRTALEWALANGVLHLQVFVDTDTAAGLVGIESVLAVRVELGDLLELRVVAFPQDGVLRDPGAAPLVEEAMRRGADVVGGIPWIEDDDKARAAHVEWACALAARTGGRVAMLTDDTGDPALRTTQMLAESLVQHGLAGRGVACHARATGLYDAAALDALVDAAGRARLGFVSAPHTGPLHLPVRRFVQSGLPVALGQDDIEDAYYPFGRNNMLEVAFLAAHLLDFRTDADQRRLVEMVTWRAAQVLGIGGHRIEVGRSADLCIHDCDRVVDLLREHRRPRWVVRRGVVVAESREETALRT